MSRKLFACINLLLMLFSVSVLITGCKKEKTSAHAEEEIGTARFENNGNGSGNVSPAMVLRWNQAAVDVVLQTQQAVPNPPIPPFYESRYYAMVNIAMHDALNSIVPKYKTGALENARDKDANPDAAVAKAAHDVIAFFFGQLNPPAFVTPQPVQDYINNLLAQSLNAIENGPAKTQGSILG